nr:hypothetical protein [Oxalobacteraceae bacterium]
MQKFLANRSLSLYRTLLVPLFIGAVCVNASAEEQTIETAALRCSAISLVHSPLTIPSPQFGELMTQFAGLFAQIHMLHKSQRTNSKVDPAEVVKQRDAIIAELNKGWPGVRNDRVRESAICNLWRSNLFARLPAKPSEKDFQQALLKISTPPTTVSKEEMEKWAALTPQAFAIWSQMKVNPKDSKPSKQ